MKSKLLLLLAAAFLVACSSEEATSEDVTEDSAVEETVVESEEEGSTQEELNKQMKEEAVEADFVKANAGEYDPKERLFVTGEVGFLNDDSVLLEFQITTEQNGGYGIYHVQSFNTTDTEFSDGDIVTVYGTYNGTSELGAPLIAGTIIEK